MPISERVESLGTTVRSVDLNEVGALASFKWEKIMTRYVIFKFLLIWTSGYGIAALACLTLNQEFTWWMVAGSAFGAALWIANFKFRFCSPDWIKWRWGYFESLSWGVSQFLFKISPGAFIVFRPYKQDFWFVASPGRQPRSLHVRALKHRHLDQKRKRTINCLDVWHYAWAAKVWVLVDAPAWMRRRISAIFIWMRWWPLWVGGSGLLCGEIYIYCALYCLISAFVFIWVWFVTMNHTQINM